jgi:signal transduction histidine kinase
MEDPASSDLFHSAFPETKPLRWHLAIFFVSLVTLGLTISIYSRVNIQGQEEVKKDLTTILKITQTALHLWKQDLKADHLALSRFPRISQLTQEQLNGSTPELTRTRLEALENVLRPWTSEHSKMGFSIFVKDPSHGIRPLFPKTGKSEEVFRKASSVIESAFTSGFELGPPFVTKDPLVLRNSHQNEVVMVAATAIKNSSGKPIAVIAFPIDVHATFSAITKVGRFGETGETYIMTLDGQMLTTSRFSERREQNSSVMSQSIRRMQDGIDIDGYQDYRGKTVVGTWLWDEQLQIGIVTEIDKVEAFKSSTMIRELLWIIVMIIVSGMTILIVLREARTRNLLKIQSLQEQDQTRKDILAVVSHDLKNPLSSLLLTNELLQKTLPANSEFTEKRKKLLMRNHLAAEQMRSLITDLLDSARMEAGKLEIHPIPCPLRDIVNNVLEVIGPIANVKNLQLKLEIPEDLPLIHADPERVMQIFSNLLGNAIKFTPEEGEIKISAVTTGNWVQCSISDTGQGISEDDLPKLFERYWQAKKAKSLGTGLGLSICKELVKSHGGVISATSIVGQGTTFTFTLPVSQKQE